MVTSQRHAVRHITAMEEADGAGEEGSGTATAIGEVAMGSCLGSTRKWDQSCNQDGISVWIEMMVGAAGKMALVSGLR